MAVKQAVRSIGHALTDSRRWREAVVEAVVGVLTAVAAGLVIYSSPLEQVGSDLSQRIAVTLPVSGGALGLPRGRVQPRGPEPHAWVFVNLGPRFCGGEPGSSNCPPVVRRTDRAALASVVRSIRAKHPRVVVLDVITSNDPADAKGDQQLLDAIVEPGAPLLLAWTPTAESAIIYPSGLVHVTMKDGDVLRGTDPDSPSASYRYLPALKSIDGPASRRLQPDYEVTHSNETKIRPGIALTAALVAASRSGHPFEAIDHFNNGQAEGGMCRAPQLCAYRETERIFSFAPVRIDTIASPLPLPGAPFIQLAPAAQSVALSDQLTDSVVVIGDPRQSAGDRSWSAVGDISGAELILNDIRQYFTAPPVPEPTSLLARLARERQFFAFGVVLLIVVALVWPFEFQPSRPLRSAVSGSLRWMLTVAINIVGFVTIMRLRPAPYGSLPDFVTPLFVLSLEQFIELVFMWTSAVRVCLRSVLRLDEAHPRPVPGEWS
jgi:hypothetical protein